MAHDSERWSPSDELLDRFLAERTAPDERAAIEGWLARTPVAQRTIQVLRQLHFRPPMSAVERQELWLRIEQQCREADDPRGSSRWHREETVRRKVSKGQGRQWMMWPAITALIVCVVTAVLGWNAGVHHISQHTGMLTYTTGNGQRATITLPDGSTAILNVASQLDVPADYVAGNRTVRLTGEALFTVSHHTGAPFIVLAGQTNTQVLGTSFAVRHYLGDSTTMVAVHDGKVSVRTPVVRSVVLTAARRLVMNRTGAVEIQLADPAVFGFTTGVLTLDGVPLRDAIAELDRWYDVDIRLGNPALAKRQIVGGFTAGSLADLAVLLEWTFDMRVVRDGRVLTLFPR